MTEKQIQRLRDKITAIKKRLAAEKKKFGGYDDSRGNRYVPPSLYIRLGDFKGGLRYLRWFWKAFPDDVGFPEFLFESAVIGFKTGKLKEAEKWATRTYFRNTYTFDIFFDRPLVHGNTERLSSYERAEWLTAFPYRHDQEELRDFSAWLREFLESEEFLSVKNEFDSIKKQLETEPVGPGRNKLIRRLSALGD